MHTDTSARNWQQLQKAISVLEQKRAILGSDVVDLTIVALKDRIQREAINGLETAAAGPLADGQRKQVTILFARVVRQDHDTASLPATDSLELSNALWRRLDEAITSHGGVIDKHVGNTVMGLFGAPTVHEDDPERATRAALAMRATLSNFVQEMTSDPIFRQGADGESAPVDTLQNLRLKVGINSGLVMFGEVGTGDEHTVIGDAVNVASRLERAASAGGILISHETYMLVRGIFQVEALGPIDIRGKSEPLPVYMVLGVKPRVFYPTGRGVEGVETRMVGRDQELFQLQMALRTAVQARQGSLVVVIGDAGVGKSRLIHEYSLWLKSLPHKVPVFKGRSDSRLSQMPYGLLRDLFTTAFGIRDTDPPTVVEHKMMRAMLQVLPGDEAVASRRVRVIAQLLGFGLFEDTAVHYAASQVIQEAYEAVAAYFELLAKKSSAVLLFLEDLHWADESSLDLISHVTQVCTRAPFIIVSVTRPQASQELIWLGPAAAPIGSDGQQRPFPIIRLRLSPLNEDESRKLVQEILRKVQSVPPSLSDVIVARSEGNPYFVEELIKVLIEDGIIITGENEWRIQRSHLTRLRVPLTLNGVLQSRLDRLSALERVTLQRAAVIGRVFWDSAISHMNEMANEPLHPSESLSALHALEKRELVFPRQNSIFSGAQAYIFKHAMLREVAYESVLLRHRPAYHKQVADWLGTQSGERVSEYASVIAEHYELAKENIRATELYEIAAMRAEETHSPDVAIDYYGRALLLLSDKAHEVEWQLRLQRRLGQLLLRRSRLVEAAQTYMTMRYTAEIDGNLAMQAHAWNGLARVQQEQADYPAMLASATQAEQVAWLVSAESELAQSLIFKAAAHLHLGQLAPARDIGEQALDLGRKNNVSRQRAEALGMLCQIAIEDGRIRDAHRCLAQLEQLQTAVTASEAADKQTMQARIKTILGTLYNELGQYEKAAFHLLKALQQYRDMKLQQNEGSVLNFLGETARLQGNTRAAVPLYEQALNVAEAVGDLQGALYYRTNLGVAQVEVGQYETAVEALQLVIARASDVSRVVTWLGLQQAQAYLTLAYIGLGQLANAEQTALQAYQLSRVKKGPGLAGLAWRTLAQLASAQPAGQQVVRLPERTFSAQECFIKSWQYIKDLRGDETTPMREKALTLQAWAHHERVNGNEKNAVRLQRQADQMASQLNITLPVLPHPAE